MPRRRVLLSASLALACLALAIVWWTWSRLRDSTSTSAPDRGGDRGGRDVRFLEVARSVGIDFGHENGARGRRFMPETTIGGAGWLDHDSDGWLDLYVVNGNLHSDVGGEGETSNRLYRNQGDGTFRDVTESTRTGDRGYGNGLAVGDYDNDGRTDLYVTNLGRNVLYHNEGNGTFRDVTAEARVEGEGWSTSAAFVDIDRDGDLDLYVCQYVAYDPEHECKFGDRPGYCSPKEFPGLPDLLYLNRGDGTFEEIGVRAGVAVASQNEGKSLGVVAFDYDDDGDSDIYVACDQVPNLLFENRGGGTFREVGALANVAYSADGISQAGMGVDVGDFDLDGRLDLVVTNFSNEANALYRNEGRGFFNDVSTAFGFAEASLLPLGFGVVFFDYDLDSDLDIFVGNGHVQDDVAHYHSMMTFKQPDQLLENVDGRSFRDGSAAAGEWFQRQTLSRAVAVADYDEDGDDDVVVLESGGPVALLRNDSATGHWIALRLVGSRSARDGYGARVTVTARRGGELVARVFECRSARSYLAACDPRVRVGLGSGTVTVEAVEVRWPSGTAQRLEGLAVDRVHTVEEPRQ